MIHEISSSDYHLLRLTGWGRYSWEFLPTKGIPFGSLNPDQKNAIFHTRFQTWPLKFRPVEIMLSLLDRKITEKKKIYFEAAYYTNWATNITPKKTSFSYSFFLIHLGLKLQIRSQTPLVPSKTIPYSRPEKRRSQYPFSDRNSANTLPTYLYSLERVTYPTHIPRGYSPPAVSSLNMNERNKPVYNISILALLQIKLYILEP